MRYLLTLLGCLLCSAKCCGTNRDKRTEIPIIAWYGAVSFFFFLPVPIRVVTNAAGKGK